MLCFVKKVLERIKDVDCLQRQNKQSSCSFSHGKKMSHIWVHHDNNLFDKKLWLLTMWCWDEQLSCWKNQESCQKNFEDEANNKQLDKVDDDTQWNNLNHIVSNLASNLCLIILILLLFLHCVWYKPESQSILVNSSWTVYEVSVYYMYFLLTALGVVVDKVFGLLTAFSAWPWKAKLLKRDKEMKSEFEINHSLKLTEVISWAWLKYLHR